MIWIVIGNMLFWLVVFEYGIWRLNSIWEEKVIIGYIIITFCSTILCLMVQYPDPYKMPLLGF